MTWLTRKYSKKLISQIPILLVLLDLHFEGVEGVDKSDSQKHLTHGNQLLHAGQLNEALTQFHLAIDNDESNYQAYYMRATVYLALGKSRSALPDLNQVVKLQPTFVKARLQRGNLFLKMGKFNEAQTDYEVVLAHEENAHATAKVEEIRPLRRNVINAQKEMELNNFNKAVELLTQVIESCPWNADYREMRSHSFEKLGDIRRAITDLKPTTQLRSDNTRAFLKMSVLWYMLGEVEQSLDEIRQCLKLDPDHKECFEHYKSVKKLFKTIESAKTKMADNNWEEAIGKLNKALAQESRIQPLTVEIKLKICECYIRANDEAEAIVIATEVILLAPGNMPAYMLRSDAHLQHANYEEAVDDLQKASQIDENYPGLNEKLKKAQKMLKQSQKRDYYKILGVSRSANKKEVTKAYRKLAREWHPDNFQDEEDKKKAEKKFIEIAAAKEVLSDPELTKIFLDGFDPLDQNDVEDWEKERAMGNSGKIFEFFFQSSPHEGGGEEGNIFENLFKTFNQEPFKRKDKTKEPWQPNNDQQPAWQQQQRSSFYQRNKQDEKIRQEEFKRRQQEEEINREYERRQQEEEIKRKREYERRQQEEEMKRKREFEKRQQELFERKQQQERQRQQQQFIRQQQEERQRQQYEKQQEKLHQQEQIRQKQERQLQFEKEQREQYEREKYEKQKLREQQNQRNFKENMDFKPEEKTTNKKKSKQNPKKRKRSQAEKDKTRSYTKGTDGKWYHKGKDGRWKVSQGPEQEDKEEDVLIKGSDGNWYKRVQPPKEDPSKVKTPKREELPRGLFYDESGEITDERGNIYVKGKNGMFTLKRESHEDKRRRQSERMGKKKDFQDRRQSREESLNERKVFKDENGNIFVKDQHGNFIKVNKEEMSPEDNDGRSREGQKDSSHGAYDRRSHGGHGDRSHGGHDDRSRGGHGERSRGGHDDRSRGGHSERSRGGRDERSRGGRDDRSRDRRSYEDRTRDYEGRDTRGFESRDHHHEQKRTSVNSGDYSRHRGNTQRWNDEPIRRQQHYREEL